MLECQEERHDPGRNAKKERSIKKRYTDIFNAVSDACIVCSVLFVSADPFDLLKLHTVQWFYKPGICGAGKLFPPYKRYNLVEGSIKYISVYLDGICDPDPPLAVTGYSGKWQNKRKEFF